MTIILAYVDEFFIIGNNLEQIVQTKGNMKHHFAIKDLGALKYFLGLKFSYNDKNDIFISQRKYSLDIWAFSDYQTANLLPLLRTRIVASNDEIGNVQETNNGKEVEIGDLTPYRSWSENSSTWQLQDQTSHMLSTCSIDKCKSQRH